MATNPKHRPWWLDGLICTSQVTVRVVLCDRPWNEVIVVIRRRLIKRGDSSLIKHFLLISFRPACQLDQIDGGRRGPAIKQGTSRPSLDKNLNLMQYLLLNNSTNGVSWGCKPCPGIFCLEFLLIFTDRARTFAPFDRDSARSFLPLIDLAKCAKTSRNSATCFSATVTCLDCLKRTNKLISNIDTDSLKVLTAKQWQADRLLLPGLIGIRKF